MTESLRDRRLAVGLSQQALAERAGCSVASLRNLEAGWRATMRGSRVLGDILAALDEAEKAAA